MKDESRPEAAVGDHAGSGIDSYSTSRLGMPPISPRVAELMARPVPADIRRQVFLDMATPTAHRYVRELGERLIAFAGDGSSPLNLLDHLRVEFTATADMLKAVLGNE